MNNQLGTMNREQTAKYMGISLPMLDVLLHRGTNPIPSIRVGRRYIISCALLEKWLEDETQRQADGR